MLVHRCDRCCVYKKEIQPCRAKYRGISAILMHKMMFPSESCNSVSKGNSVRFPLSRKFSPRVPPEPLRVPQFGNRCGMVSMQVKSTGENLCAQNFFTQVFPCAFDLHRYHTTSVPKLGYAKWFRGYAGRKF